MRRFSFDWNWFWLVFAVCMFICFVTYMMHVCIFPVDRTMDVLKHNIVSSVVSSVVIGATSSINLEMDV